MRLSILLCVLVSLPSLAQDLVISPTSVTVGVQAPSQQLFVERRMDGGLVPAPSPVTITVTSNSILPEFADTPSSGPAFWTSSRTLTMATGVSRVPFAYLDRAFGGPMLTAAATGHTAVPAQVTVNPMTISDSFEGPTLVWDEAPPGKWHQLIQHTGAYVGLDAGSAHAGAQGFAILDQDPDGTDGSSGILILRLGSGVSGNLAMRFWFRMSSPPAGTYVLIPVNLHDVNDTVLFDFRVNSAGNASVGAGNASTYTILNSSLGVADGGWHMVEMISGNIGAATATQQLFIDRLDAGRQVTDWSGLKLASVQVGQPWASPRSWTGALSFDEIKASPFFLPSGLDLRFTPTPLTANQCATLTVQLVNSLNGAVTAPQEALSVPLTFSNPTQLFYDANCSIPAPLTVDFQPYTPQLLRYVKTSVDGVLQVGATHPELFGTSVAVAVAPDPDAGVVDAGTNDGGSPDAGEDAGMDAGEQEDGGDAGVDRRRHELTVGCGCSSAGPMLSAFALLLALAARRGRRDNAG